MSGADHQSRHYRFHRSNQVCQFRQPFILISKSKIILQIRNVFLCNKWSSFLKHFFIVCDIELRFPNAFGAFHFEGIHQGTNFINILQAALAPSSILQKITHTKLNQKKVAKTLLYKKAVRKMLVKLTPIQHYWPKKTFLLRQNTKSCIQ